MFDLNRRTVTVGGQEIVLVELSAGDWADLSLETDDHKQGLIMIQRSIESPKVDQDAVAAWPRRITEELLNHIIDLNGLAEEGN